MTIKFKYTKAIIIVIITVIILSIVQVKCFALGIFETYENPKIISYKNVHCNDDDIFIWIDTETQVHYIVFEGYRKGGITPRLNNDGTLYIREQDEKH